MAQQRMPPQIVRLVLLTIGIVASFLAAKYFLTPASFGQYGAYRAAALDELASLPKTFAGEKACDECHPDEVEQLSKFEHKSLSCEACHGAAQAHVEDPESEKEKPDKQNAVACVRCHEANPSRPKWHKQIVIKEHYPGDKCTECHVPHAPLEVP